MKQKAINHQLILIIAIVLCASRVSALAVFVPGFDSVLLSVFLPLLALFFSPQLVCKIIWCFVSMS